ncbi:MAG TPA: hypothetical protein DCG12_01615 [Planctomycetaceae bacterium]|nr:hypothetical protein [Planctomycetaceae bacterium]
MSMTFRLCSALLAILLPSLRAEEPSVRGQREFVLKYQVTLGEVSSPVQVWLPEPVSDEWQRVTLLSSNSPVPPKSGRESRYGNSMTWYDIREATGNIYLSRSWRIVRKEVKTQSSNKSHIAGEDLKAFLQPGKLVPITGRPLELLEGVALPEEPYGVARLLYDRVDEHVNYDKSQPGYGNGDTLWVCDSRTGNCTDFHSLFLSLARSQKIPARFEIGFPLPVASSGVIPGYHCWAAFHDQSRGWVPVDISEADKHPEMKEYYFGSLTANRVRFSTGRDINLVPQQASEPLNYFVYPHVEEDGKVVPKSRIQLRVSFRNTFAD